MGYSLKYDYLSTSSLLRVVSFNLLTDVPASEIPKTDCERGLHDSQLRVTQGLYSGQIGH